jgi:exopolysaccharide production protein ExoQ
MVTASSVHTTQIPSTGRLHSVQRLVISWVLMLPLMFFAVHGVFSWEDTGNNPSSGNSLTALTASSRHLGFLGYVVIPGVAYSIVVWLIVINVHRVLPLTLRMKMITLLALLTIFSAAWSQNPFRSAYNGIFYFVDTLFAFYLVLRFDPEELLSLVMMAGVSLSVMSLLLIVLFPHFALVHEARDLGAWQGVFGDRNLAAKALVFLLSPALIFRQRSLSFRNLLYVALMLCMVLMTKSATARLIVPVYITFMASTRIVGRFSRRSALLVCAALFTIAAVTAYIGLTHLPFIAGSLGRTTNLSGRTFIWDLVLRAIAKRPLLGYGYYAFWQGLTGESASAIIAANWVLGYAHNGILEICLQLGLVGTTIFFVTLFQAIGNAWLCLRKGCPPGVEWYMGVIALTIMYNIDEATVVWPNELLSILYIVACCGLAKAAWEIKSRRTLEALYN